MQIESLNADKRAHARKCVTLFLELCCFLSVQARPVWPVTRVELYPRWSRCSRLCGLGRAATIRSEVEICGTALGHTLFLLLIRCLGYFKQRDAK